MPPPKKTESIAELAERFNASPRTIKRWKREGAPLNDPRKMRTWLSTRKNLPPGLKSELMNRGRLRRAKIASDAPSAETGTVGAPAALKRLERAEMTAYRLLQSAMKLGDVYEIKAAREGWLKVGDSLRRYDLLVENARRDSGEMVQRSEVERHVSSFVRAFKTSIRRTVATISPELAALDKPADVSQALEGELFNRILEGCATLAAQPCKIQVPEWFIAAALKPMEDTLIFDRPEAL